MAYYNPYIMRSISRSIQTANDQGFGYCSCRYDEYTSGQNLGPSTKSQTFSESYYVKLQLNLKGLRVYRTTKVLLNNKYTSDFNSIPYLPKLKSAEVA